MLTNSPDIFTIFSALTDPRQVKKVEHKLSDMLVIALCGAVCGVDTWADLERFADAKEEWFRRFLEAIADPKHEQHDDFVEWAGEFDSEEFDAGETTKAMRRGLPDWRQCR